MCGTSDTKIRDRDAFIKLGDSGGILEIGDLQYAPNWGEVPREQMVQALAIYSKEELIDLLLNFCDNAVEG
jgi:hypothetical protein